MTRTEQAELQELGMTPERLAENQAKVAAILHGDKLQVQAFEYSEAKPPKKRRSDAGVPRVKPSPAVPEGAQTGRISEGEAVHLDSLVQKMRDTENNLQAATDAHMESQRAYREYLGQLTYKQDR